MKENQLTVVRGRAVGVRSAVAAALLFAAVQVHAAANLPAAVGTAITQAQDDGVAIFDLAFPYIAAMVGLSIVITLFKRFVKRG